MEKTILWMKSKKNDWNILVMWTDNPLTVLFSKLKKEILLVKDLLEDLLYTRWTDQIRKDTGLPQSRRQKEEQREEQ